MAVMTEYTFAKSERHKINGKHSHSFIHSYSFIKTWQNANKQLQQPKLETIKIKDKSADIYPIYKFRVMMYER